MNIIRRLSDEEIQNLFDNYNSVSKILKSLNLSSSCGYYRKLLKDRSKNIDLSQHNKNKEDSNPFANNFKKYSDEEVFCINGEADIKTVKLRFEKREKKKSCSACGIKPVWEGKVLNFHFDHINGNNKDNRLCNLRWLCPNCHSQTETYTGKNKKL